MKLLAKHIALIFSIVIFLLISFSSWAGVTAEVNRHQVAFGESFVITFHIDGGNQARPNLKPLTKNFDIISTSRNSEIMIVNGISKNHNTLNVELMPKKIGTFKIPAIQFGVEKSQALKIKVNKPSSMVQRGQLRHIFIEAKINNKTPYVQAAVYYNVKLFVSVPISNGNLTSPEFKDAVIEIIGADKRYKKSVHGVAYQVIERNYAIFPQKSGQANIIPPVFTGLQIQARSFFNTGAKTVRVAAPMIKLNVLPTPQKLAGNNWIPSTRLTLKQSWSAPLDKLKIGQPITRTITLRATDLTAAQLPDLASNSNITDHSNFNIYSDKSTNKNIVINNRIIGQRTFKVAYVPTSSGSITIPSIKLNWWNTSKKRLETALLKSSKLTVAGGQATSHKNNTMVKNYKVITETDVKNHQDSKNTKQTQSGMLNKHIMPFFHEITSDSIWQIISIILLFFWIATLCLWWLYTKKKAKQHHKEDKNILPKLW